MTDTVMLVLPLTIDANEVMPVLSIVRIMTTANRRLVSFFKVFIRVFLLDLDFCMSGQDEDTYPFILCYVNIRNLSVSISFTKKRLLHNEI